MTEIKGVLNNNGSITFVVMATDHGQPPLTGTTEVTVNVIDMNDNCPYYSENDKEVTYVFNYSILLCQGHL
jgi:hypothetical protein